MVAKEQVPMESKPVVPAAPEAAPVMPVVPEAAPYNKPINPILAWTLVLSTFTLTFMMMLSTALAIH